MDTSNPMDLDKTFCSIIENWNTDEELLKSKLRPTTRNISVQSTVDSQKLLRISELVIAQKYGIKKWSIEKLKSFYDEIQNLTTNGEGIPFKQKRNASKHLKYIQNIIKCNASNSLFTQPDEGFSSFDLGTQTTQNAFISETPNRDITQQSVLLPKSMTEIEEMPLSGTQTVRKRKRITKNKCYSKKSRLQVTQKPTVKSLNENTNATVNSIIENVIKLEPADIVDEPNPEVQIAKTSQNNVKQSKIQKNITNNPKIQYSNTIILAESKMEKEPLSLQESMAKDVKRSLRGSRKRTVKENQPILSPPKNLQLVKCPAKPNDTELLNPNNLNQTQENMPVTDIDTGIGNIYSYPEQFSTENLNVQPADAVEPNLTLKIVENTKLQSSATNFKRNKKSYKSSQVDIISLSQRKSKAKPKSKANPKRLGRPKKCPRCRMEKNENENPNVLSMPKKVKNAKKGKQKKEKENLPVLSSIENLQFEKCASKIIYPKNLNLNQESWPQIDKVMPLYDDNNSKIETGSFFKYPQQFPSKCRNVEQPNYPTYTSSPSTSAANLPLSIADYGTQHSNNIDNNGNVKRYINNIDKVIFKSCALMKSIMQDEDHEHCELEFQNWSDEELLLAEKEVTNTDFLYVQDTNFPSSSVPAEIKKSIEHSYKPEDVLKYFQTESKNLTEEIADSTPKYYLTNKHVSNIADVLNINSEDLHFLIKLIIENDEGGEIVDRQNNSNLQAPSDTDSVVSASQSPINRRYRNRAIKL